MTPWWEPKMMWSAWLNPLYILPFHHFLAAVVNTVTLFAETNKLHQSMDQEQFGHSQYVMPQAMHCTTNITVSDAENKNFSSQT